MEDVYAEEEEQQRHEVLENVASQLGLQHPICYDSYCLCDLLHDRKLKTFSVVMVKQMLKYFSIPYGSRNRKTTQVTELLTLLEGCDCH